MTTIDNPAPTGRAMPADRQTYDTVIIGGGQCGLAAGYYLVKQSLSFVILDENQQVGDSWRRRYDSLRLYSPSRYDGLPGYPFPAKRHTFPTGTQMADYLESYAARFQLPVHNGVAVSSVRRAPNSTDGYVVSAGNRMYDAKNVIIATGGQHLPYVPDFAGELDAEIRQFHSSDYRNPSQLREGGLLVVGASHSGADLALECVATHQTWLVGPDKGEIPFDIEGRPARAVLPVLWFAANHVLSMSTPIGRKMQDEVRSHGGPLLRYKNKHLLAVGVQREVGRVEGVQNGKPILEDGRILDVANVIWCTGFRQDFSWIEMPILDDTGWPKQDKGIAAGTPGLYFVGLLFQHSFSSMLVGGSGRDARWVTQHINARSRKGAKQTAAA